jgi:hypothetical protein
LPKAEENQVKEAIAKAAQSGGKVLLTPQT